MKGKKFTAAEKHFREKEVKLRQEMQRHKEWLIEVSSVNSQLLKENEQLKKENAALKAKYEKLLELSKLSDGDVKAALRANNAVDMFMGLFDQFGRRNNPI